MSELQRRRTAAGAAPGGAGAAERAPGKASRASRASGGAFSSLRGPVAASLALFAAAALLVSWRDAALPTPLSGAEAGPSGFSEQRARVHLDALVALGPRTTGSQANEVGAVQYLLRELRAVEAGASTPGFRVEIDVQRPSGTLSMDFFNGFTSVYRNVTNVLARVTATGTRDEAALLVSAHYDSQIGTNAASDDTVNVASMLEMVRAMSHAPALRHQVVFNFNGAEETILQASHGFITQHPWARNVQAFVNLEAAGTGGRELVFQAGPKHAWLARAYASSAPRPFCSSLAADIFQSGVIPSDTDFRIYRDYGLVPGLDVAYISNGYAYHTTRDTPESITPGSVQHCGENMLATLRHIASGDELADPGAHAHEVAVYYDVLGLFAVVYSDGAAALLNAAGAAGACAVIAAGGGLGGGTARALVALVAAVLAALAAPAAAGAALYFGGRGLSWYANPWLVPGLFLAPAAAAMLSVQRWFGDRQVRRALAAAGGGVPAAKTEARERASLERSSFHAALALWTVVLVCVTWKGFGSAYLALHWVVWPAAARLAGGSPAASWRGVAVYLAGLAAPTLVCGQLLWVLLEFFVPVQGRVGTHVVADAVIGVISGLVVAVLLLAASSLVHVDRSWRAVRRALLLVFFASAAAAVAVAPYSAERPKRLFAQHSRRLFHEDGALVDEKNGVWLTPIDPLGFAPLRDARFRAHLDECGERCTGSALLPDLLETPLHYLDHEGVYGSHPWLMPLSEMINGFVRLPAARPPAGHGLEVSLVSSEAAGDGRRRRVFNVTGPDHMSLYVRRGPGSAELVDWSLATEHGGPMSSAAGDVYFVYFASGNPGGAGEGERVDAVRHWSFWLETRADDERKLHMAVAGHYFPSTTPELDEAKSLMPAWIDLIGWVSEWHGHAW